MPLWPLLVLIGIYLGILLLALILKIELPAWIAYSPAIIVPIYMVIALAYPYLTR